MVFKAITPPFVNIYSIPLRSVKALVANTFLTHISLHVVENQLFTTMTTL